MDVELLRKRCNTLLLSLVGENLADLWWSTKNTAFNKTPQMQFDENPTIVYNYLKKHIEGDW